MPTPSTHAARPRAREGGPRRRAKQRGALRIGRLGPLDALNYLALLAAEAPDRYERAARTWLARLLAESPALRLNEVDVALGCLRGIAALYEEQSREVLRELVKASA
jgi:hypothetical protein